MKNETLEVVKKALSESNLDSLFSEAIGVPEDITEEDQARYALMFDLEKNKLFFLQYATSDNSWAKTAESQNPWILLGYVSANDIIMGNPAGEISDRLDYEFEQQEQMDREYKEYNATNF